MPIRCHMSSAWTSKLPKLNVISTTLPLTLTVHVGTCIFLKFSKYFSNRTVLGSRIVSVSAAVTGSVCRSGHTGSLTAGAPICDHADPVTRPVRRAPPLKLGVVAAPAGTDPVLPWWPWAASSNPSTSCCLRAASISFCSSASRASCSFSRACLASSFFFVNSASAAAASVAMVERGGMAQTTFLSC